MIHAINYYATVYTTYKYQHNVYMCRGSMGIWNVRMAHKQREMPNHLTICTSHLLRIMFLACVLQYKL